MSPAGEKYRVIRKLDSGGMAEVFIGEAESLQGFKKRVAIKRVLPHLVENRKFLAMFLDEARLSLRLNHANVVQVFDIGRSGNTYFIVMEYVDGNNLKGLYEHLLSMGELLPVELSCFIITEICRGLAYAHALKDSEGNLLGIVHRDVSPPNILLSKQGEVKIVDFGLAKATSQLEHTDPGVVKGKFAYLSPESAWGRHVDRRADVFACGIILWELLTGQRLFLGQSDIETVELVRRADVPSVRRINPRVPEKLDRIVLKALALRPEHRFEDCGQLAEAIMGFLFEHGLKVTSFDLQRLVRRVNEEQPVAPQPKQSIIDQLIQEELNRFASLDDEDSGFTEPTGPVDGFGATPLDYLGFDSKAADRQDRLSGRNWSVSSSRQQPAFVVDPDDSYPERDFSGSKEFSVSSVAPSRGEEESSLAHMLEGEIRLGSEPASSSKTGRVFMVVMTLVAAAAIGGAIGAYFLGWIP